MGYNSLSQGGGEDIRLFVQDTQPSAGETLEGYLWSDTTANLLKRATAPSTFVSTEGGAAAHDILSATHGDTLAAAVVQGDLILGNATPEWSRLAIGANNRILRSNGTTAAWLTPSFVSNLFRIFDVLDVTKELDFDLSGITTATIRTITMPDSDVDLTNVHASHNINLASEVTGILPVANGGSGASSLTDGGILVGSGSGAVTALTRLTKGQIQIGQTTGDPLALSAGTDGQRIIYDSAQTGGAKTEDIVTTASFVISGGGNPITTGKKGVLKIHNNWTVTSWHVYADVSGSIVVDINRASHAGFPTTSSIAGSELPTLSAAQKAEDTTLTTWSDLNDGDVIEFEVDSASTVKLVTVALKLTRKV